MARRQLHDEYFKRAKAEGYLARSAYKLLEINERKRLFGSGDRVLDLGCAPGAWVQVALEIVGPRGVVVGIDLKDATQVASRNSHILRGDIYQTPASVLTQPAGGQFDAVLSDMAPDTTGHGDDFLSVRLCRRAIELLPDLLRPGGNFCIKVFEGEEYPSLLREVASMFQTAKGFKPKASRDISREMYVVAHGYRGRAAPAPQPQAAPGAGATRGGNP